MGGRIINWRQLEKATRNGRGEERWAHLPRHRQRSVALLCASGQSCTALRHSHTHSLIGQAQLTYPLSCLPGLCLCVLSCKARTGR
jgi:hypothetical protein